MNPSIPPAHWSPEQALAVYEFIHQLAEQLWLHYRHDFERALGADAAFFIQPPTPPSPQIDLFDDDVDQDDNLPF